MRPGVYPAGLSYCTYYSKKEKGDKRKISFVKEKPFLT